MSRRIDLRTLVDRGYWISDDRVSAYLSEACSGIAEVDYHGRQPVSRNARLLWSTEGVLSFYFRVASEEWKPVDFGCIEWYPAGSTLRQPLTDGELIVKLVACKKCISCKLAATSVRKVEVQVRFFPRALMADVQGVRKWSVPNVMGHYLYLSCRDRILSREWLRRKGPYAGDFLIPEPWRRLIFLRSCRSGLATLDDVRPEFRDADFPFYDAEVHLRLGGDAFEVHQDDGAYIFTTVIDKKRIPQPSFTVQFADRPSDFEATVEIASIDREQRRHYAELASSSPRLGLPGFDEVMEFFGTVPALVDSCWVRELGMTRANPGAYYWIWSWDNLVSALEMSRWGGAENLRRIVEFVNAHRDVDGRIPGRWTRSLMPLDTPPRGALEFLHLLATSELYRQTGDRQPLVDAYPFYLQHFEAVASASDPRGLFTNIGFYPDLPERFGRSEKSIVALEVAAYYSFCRLLEDAAGLLEDHPRSATARDMARRIQANFLPVFWDEGRGFLLDSVESSPVKRNESYPLFTLLFLQSPLGFPLIREKLQEMARFGAQHNLTDYGIGLLPGWDRNRHSEPAMQAWYPHWDIYLLKLLRRTGRSDDIMRWLRNIQRVLQTLGYCPEFLSLEGFENDEPDAWRRHGAVSNLNCVTGWYRAVLEGVMGLEFDPGGMTIVPLALPLGEVGLRGLKERGTTWDIRIKNDGPKLREVRVDGQVLEGSLKIPSHYQDGKNHKLEIVYAADGSDLYLFQELINAEVLEIRHRTERTTLSLRCLGTVDVSFRAPQRATLLLDGAPLQHNWDNSTNTGRGEIHETGEHEITLTAGA